MKLFIFGSTGDLVKRKVIPALAELKPNDLKIIALGRKDLNTNSYKEWLLNQDPRIEYKRIDTDNLETKEFLELLDKSNENFFYLALPPKVIEKILIALAKLKKKGFKIRILVEKPFGENLENSKSLKKLISKENLQEDLLIADHYLFKQEIINHPIKKFNHLKLVSLEKVGLENRIGYYDEIGALKDMIQSHFLNIIFKLIENPKQEFKDFEILEYKLAQYGNGKDKGYVKELGKSSTTETFVKIRLKTKNHEFTLITGKKFKEKLSYIQVEDKKTHLSDLKNPYQQLFLDFFSNNKTHFTTIDNSILAWKISSKLETNKPKLEYYEENTESNSLVN